MAIVTELSPGPPYALTQNVIYALPARACKIGFVGVAPVVSPDNVTYVALDSDNIVSDTFIKSTGTTTVVKLSVF